MSLHKKQQSMLTSPSPKAPLFRGKTDKSRVSQTGRSDLQLKMTEKKLNTYMNQAKLLIDKQKEETLSAALSERGS